jgi:hypothetical protein
MALIRENDLTEGMSGKFGRKIVFRVVRGVTVAVRRSTRETVQSEKQLAQVERFRRATLYAKAKMLDPIAKAEYKQMVGDKAFHTAFSAAVGDYLVGPKIMDVKVSEFAGAAGSVIPVTVFNNFKIIRMKVAVIGVNGVEVESGEASFTTGETAWKYVTTQSLSALSGVKIVVTAIDRPGNETTYEKLLT